MESRNAGIFSIFFFLRKLSLRLEHNSCYALVIYNKNIFNIIHILYPVYLLKYDNINQFEWENLENKNLNFQFLFSFSVSFLFFAFFFYFEFFVSIQFISYPFLMFVFNAFPLLFFYLVKNNRKYAEVLKCYVYMYNSEIQM